MTILVTGCAGYIGSHTCKLLIELGESVVGVDNLGNGHEESLSSLDMVFINGDVCDSRFIETVIKDHKVDAVIHFAAFIEVGESVQDPLKYFNNNINSSLSVLTAMKNTGCKHFVFSSTAAIFGIPEVIPIRDDAPTNPINPYGESKLTVEKILKSLSPTVKSVCLRYFNASGAHSSGEIGEAHNPETHLIPLVLQVAQGKREKIMVFGNDYNTPDGSCVRDYIHIMDLADAHYKALLHLRNGGQTDCFNLGCGVGYSVLEVIETARKVTNHPIPAEIAPRRPGDPDILVADSSRAIEVLGWERRLNDLEKIIASAWKWHSEHPNGYE
ncbi:hypothetical protein P9112_001710 [Eukaryota sp. TZLM1-RC]